MAVRNGLPNPSDLPNLGMDGDGDDLDIVVEIENSFGISIRDEQASSINNVGELYDLILQSQDSADIGDKCRSAMAFYILRRQIHKSSPLVSVRPSTILNDLPIGEPSRFLSKLKADNKLSEPAGTEPIFLNVFILALFVSPIVAILAGALGVGTIAWCGAAVFVTSIFCLRFVPRVWSPPNLTVGALAKLLVAKNHAEFSKRGAANRPKDTWESLIQLLAVQMAVPKEKIGFNTEFFSAAKNFESQQ